MSSQELATKIRKGLAELQRVNRPLLLAASSAHAMMAKRIFTNGLNTNLSPIGQYNDTDPMYINPKTSPGKKITPKGKNGETRFKNGKPHKTTYVESYKAYKALIGRNNSKVNLFLSGDLKSDFENPAFIPGAERKEQKGEVKPSPEGINSYVVYWKRSENAEIARGQEQHFNCRIFSPSEAEKKEFFTVAEKELRKMFEP